MRMAEQIVTHDERHGVSYIYLAGRIPAGGVASTVSVPPGRPSMCLDFDSNGHLIGIELLEPGLLHPALKAVAVEP